jgi:hypothetical protein
MFQVVRQEVLTQLLVTIESIKNRRKPRAEGVGLKMLYELFSQMAV